MLRVLLSAPVVLTVVGIAVCAFLGCTLHRYPPQTSSDVAAWIQAIGSVLALVAAAGAVAWQTRSARADLAEREARTHEGLAHLLIHLRDTAIEARAEKQKLERWPKNHPAEPYKRFLELATALRQFPLESMQGEVPFEAILNARRALAELEPLVDETPELDVNRNFELVFSTYMARLDDQITLLRKEAARLLKGERAHHATALAKV